MIFSASSLAELAKSCPDLSTFSKLLSQVDKDYGKWMLDCTGRKCEKLAALNRTVFLPVNAAWNRYFAASGLTLADLTSRRSRKALTALMRYHVLPRVFPSSAVVAGSAQRLSTLQGEPLVLARRSASSQQLLVRSVANEALVLRADLEIGTPVVHLVSDVLLLEALPPPSPSPPPAPPAPPPSPLPPSPPPPSPSPAVSTPAPTALPSATSASPSPSPSPRPSVQPLLLIGGRTVFNLTWNRPVDMDLIIVAQLPTAAAATNDSSTGGGSGSDSGGSNGGATTTDAATPAPGYGNTEAPGASTSPAGRDPYGDGSYEEPTNITMFYSWTGPEPLIGGGHMTAGGPSDSDPTTKMRGFYSRAAGSWEALVWDAPLRPAQAVYDVCAFFYNLEWAPGTVVDVSNPILVTLTVTTGTTPAATSPTVITTAAPVAPQIVALPRLLTQPGGFSFTLVPRNCTPSCPWYMGAVCVDASGGLRMVQRGEQC